jgi:hypothetical protein
MIILTDTVFHAKSGDPANMQVCPRGTWNTRMLGETVLSMLTTVCHCTAIPATHIKSYATLSSAQADSLLGAYPWLAGHFLETESLRAWLKRHYPSRLRHNIPTATRYRRL